MNRTHCWLGGAALIGGLLGCGGGGGGGGSPTPSPPPAPPPLIVGQTYSATEDTDFTGFIATRAGSAVTLSVTSNPTRGTITAISNDGGFTYRPSPDLNGPDTFTVEALDGANNRLSAVMTVNVAAVDDAPVANGEVTEVPASTTVALNVLANDSDVDDTALSVVIPAAKPGEEPNPAVGTATVDSNNQIQLTLPANFKGVTRVRYQVRDPAGAQSDVATATAFVGTPRFDLWFVGPRQTTPATLQVTDLLKTREVHSFTATRFLNGAWLSQQKNVVVFGETEQYLLRSLWAVPTQGVQAAVRITPDYGLDKNIDGVVVSPDGAWVAYVLVDGTLKQVWLASLADPNSAVCVTLPAEATGLRSFYPLRFAPNSDALYIVTTFDANSERLLRVPVTSPTTVVPLYPAPGEYGQVFAFFPSADDSYVVVRYDNLYKIPTANPAVRAAINASLPADQLTDSVFADPTATRFVYETTTTADLKSWGDDRLWSADVAAPGVSTQVLDADPARTSFGVTSFRPDRNAALVAVTYGTDNDSQTDLAELSLSPADGQLRVLNSAPPAGTHTHNDGMYLDDGSVLLIERQSLAPSRLYELRRADLATPVAVGEAGIISFMPMLSRDQTVFAYSHSRNLPDDSGTYGVLVNRAAPGVLMRVTPAGGYSTDVIVIGAVERH